MNDHDVRAAAGRIVQDLRADAVLVIAVRGESVIPATGDSGDPPPSAWLARIAPSLAAIVDGHRANAAAASRRPDAGMPRRYPSAARRQR